TNWHQRDGCCCSADRQDLRILVYSRTLSVRMFALSCVALLASACRHAGNESERESMRVVSYNIRHGRGTDDQLDLQRTASVLRALQPDIVGLQEVDSSVTRSERVAQADSLGKLLGMHASFGGFFAYQGGQYGMGVLSRYPIVRVVPIRLPDG